MAIDTMELMNAVFAARPVDFDKGMTDQIQDKVAELVADRKLEVAKTFFTPADATVEISDEEPDETLETQDDSVEDDTDETTQDDDDETA